MAILGGGPAGTATALSLRAHAPSLSVTLIEQSNYSGLRIGETLPPTVQSLLEHLGVWSTFEHEGHLPAYGTCATWGSNELFENEFIFHPVGGGWHVDRRRFDAMLAREAASKGVDLIYGSKFIRGEKTNKDHWNLSVQTARGGQLLLEAKFVVDATGRRGVFAAQQGVRKTLLDQLLGVFVFLGLDAGDSFADSYTLVEPWEDGWWYSALVPGEKLAVACMTDVDIATKYRLNSSPAWFDLIAKSRHTKERIRNAKPLGGPSTYPAFSHRLEQITGDGWLAAGDAATTFDPLSSLGIQKGLRSGILASYAIADYFKGSASSLEKYEAILAKEFEEYLSTRTDYYCQERRWQNSAFWQRRYDQITLDPRQMLRLSEMPGQASAVERLSMHLPVSDLKYLCDLCSVPGQAHEIVSKFKAQRSSTPDRRVILALQYLAEEGLIKSAAA